MAPKAKPLSERFWAKVDRRGLDECWEWQGSRTGRGRYGNVKVDSYTNAPSHRVAWELTNGPVPEELCVCHRCDNPPCCNPAHLFLGTHQDNMIDKVAKGRQSRGEEHSPRTRRDRMRERLGYAPLAVPIQRVPRKVS